MARYCSYCGRRGHNRRTCPHRSEEQKQVDKTWHNKPGPKRGAKSICSYCGECGHNRRTCWHLKYRKKLAETFIEGALAFALQQYQTFGLGPGSLYERTDSWRGTKATYLITDGLAVGYGEQIIRQGSGQWDDDLQYVPTFTFSIMGKRVFGDRDVDRDIGPQVTIYNDLAGGKKPVSNTRYLRQFCAEEENNKIVGKADHPFSEEVVQRLRDWAAREVKEFFQNKDNRHPNFGDFDSLHFIRAEAESEERMKG